MIIFFCVCDNDKNKQLLLLFFNYILYADKILKQLYTAFYFSLIRHRFKTKVDYVFILNKFISTEQVI